MRIIANFFIYFLLEDKNLLYGTGNGGGVSRAFLRPSATKGYKLLIPYTVKN
jgi:hypothetical protein